jgi:hypothetical protein
MPNPVAERQVSGGNHRDFTLSRRREGDSAVESDQNKARTLLNLAQDPKNLCMQEALFLPWF